MNIEVARTTADAEALRPVWEPLQRPDVDQAPRVLRPHVVVLEEGGEPVGLAVGRLEIARSPTRLGYAMLFNPHVRSLTVVCGGLPVDEGNVGRLVNAVIARKTGRLPAARRRRRERLGDPSTSEAAS